MSERKILIIITTGFVPWGGLTTVAMNYYRAMDKSGLQIDFASCNKAAQSLAEELEQNSSKYIQLPDRQKHVMKYMSVLYSRLKKEHYDVVHIHGNSATMAIDLLPAWLAGVKKRIVHVHNIRNQHEKLGKLLSPFMNSFLTDRLAVSKEAGGYLYGKEPFCILNNAIDVEHYRYNQELRKKCRETWGIPTDAFVVGTVGKMNAQKNQMFLLEVFAGVLKTMPDTKLLIVGDGELREELVRKAQLLGVEGSCILAGMQEDVAEFLSAMDVFVFPSIYEGISLALVEAQASGMNCYYTNSLTGRGIITDNCFGVDLRYIDDWVSAIVNVGRCDREEISDISIVKLREYEFDINSMAEQLRKLYV